MKQFPLLIEIGHEEMPAMGGEVSDHLQGKTCKNYLAVRLFDFLKKSQLFSSTDKKNGGDVVSDDTSSYLQATSRRMVLYFPNLNREINNKTSRYQAGPAISERPGSGLVQAYRGFLKKHDGKLSEKMAAWSDAQIIDYVDKLPNVPPDGQDGFFKFGKLCFGGLFVENILAKELIKKILPQALKTIFDEVAREGFLAQMYWGEKRGPFVRPIRNLCVIFGEELIDCEIYGVKSSRESFSHRLLRANDGKKKHHFGGVVVPIKSASDYFFEVAKHGVLLGNDGRFLAGGGVDCRWKLTTEQNEKVNRLLFGEHLGLSGFLENVDEKSLPIPEIFKPYLSQKSLQDFAEKSFSSTSFLLCLLVIEWLFLLEKSFEKEDNHLFSKLVSFCIREFENNFREKLKKEKKNPSDDEKQKEILPFKILYYRDLPHGVSSFSHLASEYLLKYEYPQPFVLSMPFQLHLPDFVVLEVLKIQEYFPVYAKRDENLIKVDEPQKELMPVCIGIADNPNRLSSSIKQGHERVLKARLADAEFFYQKDLDMGIDPMREKLKSMSYHVDIGSYDEYIAYTKRLADRLWEMDFFKNSNLASLDELKLALNYAKADLASEMIGEYPDLAGRMGENYLLKKNDLSSSGDIACIAYAIYWQNFVINLLLEENDVFSFWSFSLFFSPIFEKGAEKNPVKSLLGNENVSIEETNKIFSPRKNGTLPISLNFVDSFCHVALLYATGLRPLGRGDKYGLRPQIAKIVEIAIIKNWTIDLKVIAPLIDDVQKGIVAKDQNKTLPKVEDTLDDLSKVIGKSFSYHFDYLEKWNEMSLANITKERGGQFGKMVGIAILDPAISKRIFDPDFLVRRYCQIIELVQNDEHFTSYLEAHKRIGNILRKSNENIDNLIEHFDGHWKDSYYTSLGDENAEKKLYMRHLEIEKQVAKLDENACDKNKRKRVSTIMKDSAGDYFVDRVSVNFQTCSLMKNQLLQQIFENNPFIICRQYLKELDHFFDTIMINDPDESIRKNRLSFLAQIQKTMSCGVSFDKLR